MPGAQEDDMDLRGYSVPKEIDEIIRTHEARKLIWYQPFIFSDTAIVGTAAAWNNTLGIRKYACTDADPPEVRRVFLEQNARLGDWYETLVAMCLACSPESQEFLDLGCNAGHFSFQVAKLGKKATGVDVWKDCYQFVSDILGVSFEYLNERYDSATHGVPSLEGRKFDFVFASAIQTHLSDPHFFMAYTNRLARHGLLYTTPVIAGTDPYLRLRITAGRREREMPERFEFLPTVSAMELLLQCMRPFVYRRASQSTDPKNTSLWGTWIALDHEIPEAVAQKFHLSRTPNRIEQFADVAQGSFSVPRAKLGERA
jgi:SAM-dependent methyltransferase